jgi:hypothetical protein
MSDTEEVVLQSSKSKPGPKNTKPEIAREKLKEKRERLKREKDEKLIEEAKKRIADDETAKKQKEAEAQAAKQNDPMFKMSEQMSQMMEVWKLAMAGKVNVNPEDEDEMIPVKPVKKTKSRASKPPVEPVEEEIAIKKPRAKKAVAIKEPPTPKPRPSRPARKPKQILYEEDSPSNQFIGSAPTAPPQPDLREQVPQNHLLNQIMMRRNMNSFSF